MVLKNVKIFVQTVVELAIQLVSMIVKVRKFTLAPAQILSPGAMTNCLTAIPSVPENAKVVNALLTTSVIAQCALNVNCDEVGTWDKNPDQIEMT